MADFSFLIVPILCFVFGFVLDRLFGDPEKLPHLVVGFGRLISLWEKHFNKKNETPKAKRIHGAIMGFVLTYGTLLLTIILISLLYGTVPSIGILAAIILIFYCLAGTSLIKEVRQVFIAVDQSLEAGRSQVGRIVGRDTSELSAQEIRIAALETLAENLNDGVIAPIFYFFFGVFLALIIRIGNPLLSEMAPLSLGVAFMVAFKMVNTLDSMVAYRNEKYIDFGRYSAIQDDIWGYIPARLTAIFLLIAGGQLKNLKFVRKFGRAHLSPNSGYPEAAMASLLNCRFGGPHNYFGKEVYKPYIGENERAVGTEDCTRSIHYARVAEIISIVIFIFLLCILGLIAI